MKMNTNTNIGFGSFYLIGAIRPQIKFWATIGVILGI